MGILDALSEQSAWEEFLDYRARQGRLPGEEAQLAAYVAAEAYLPAVRRMLAEGPSAPEKRRVNKFGSDKKRTVYAFPEEENLILKALAYRLGRYDGQLPENCYSFRRTFGARRAIRRLIGTPGIDKMFCYKADVHDYFNSVDADKLLPMLQTVFADDPPLYAFFARMLTADMAVENGVRIVEKRGIMAGTPTSPFLANVYLAGIDRRFWDAGVPYARYSDDIVVFAKDAETLDAYRREIGASLAALSLTMNPDKEHVYAPGEAWEFLGVQYFGGGRVDVSRATADKLKGKLRRKARAILRWKLRKNADDLRAMRAYARSVNRKLFENPRADELTWARWFFPLVTTDESLRMLDDYIRDCMRYVATGRHNGANYRISHETLQDCGLVSLVNAYYRWQKERNRPALSE